MLQLCQKYNDIFHLDDTPLSFTNQIKHQINTTDEVPVFTRSYRYPHVHKPEVEKQIKEMLKQNIIQASNSPWSSPIWMVPKKQDASGKVKWRLVVDYRKLNEKTVSDRYPIPNINDILDKLGRCQYFSVLDLKSGFYQIEMDPKYILKTAFTVDDGHRGHYEYLRMPFGLKNAPSTFQRMMDTVLRGLKNVTVYMDDLIIYSSSLQEHIQDLEAVLQRLRESNLKVQLDKTEFLKKETPFLGHIVTAEGVKPDPSKIKSIQQFPIPKTNKEIKSFLGLLGYYRKFIPNFAHLTKPMTACLKKGKKIELTTEYINCFEHCRNLLMNDPILQYPDFEKDFNLRTDASNFALGAVLSQGPIGTDRPVAYASRTLNDTKVKYSTIEKELLAIVWATKYFRPYLYGRKFNIITDHKPLQYLMNMKEPNGRLTRWRLRLEEFDYKIIYKSGKSNSNADALSRVQICNNELENMSLSCDEDDLPLSMFVNQSKIPAEETVDNIECSSTIHTELENPILEIPISDQQINTFDNQLFIDFVLHSPTETRTIEVFPGKKRMIVQINKNNVKEYIIQLFQEHIKPNIKYGIFVSDTQSIPEITSILQRIYKHSAFKLIFCKSKVDDVICKEKQFQIIKNVHEGKTNHRGIQEIEKSIKSHYYWPNIKRSITEYINNCTICQTSKYERNPSKLNFQIVPIPEKPFDVLHIDTFTVNRQKFLTIIDVFSKYAQAYPLDSVTGLSVINALTIYISHHGVPISVTADQGTEFKNLLIQEFFNLHKIKLHFISVNNPQSNGAIERFHSTILEHIRVLSVTQPDLNTNQLMVYAVIGYNNSIHSATNKKPVEIINGHTNSRDPFDINLEILYLQNYVNKNKDVTKQLYSEINKKLMSNQEKTMQIANKDRQDALVYDEGKALYVKNPLAVRHKTKARYLGRRIKRNLDLKVIDDRNISHHKRILRKPLKGQTSLFQDRGDDPGPSSSHHGACG